MDLGLLPGALTDVVVRHILLFAALFAVSAVFLWTTRQYLMRRQGAATVASVSALIAALTAMGLAFLSDGQPEEASIPLLLGGAVALAFLAWRRGFRRTLPVVATGVGVLFALLVVNPVSWGLSEHMLYGLPPHLLQVLALVALWASFVAAFVSRQPGGRRRTTEGESP
jgi:hypothetical protein